MDFFEIVGTLRDYLSWAQEMRNNLICCNLNLTDFFISFCEIQESVDGKKRKKMNFFVETKVREDELLTLQGPKLGTGAHQRTGRGFSEHLVCLFSGIYLIRGRHKLQQATMETPLASPKLGFLFGH